MIHFRLSALLPPCWLCLLSFLCACSVEESATSSSATGASESADTSASSERRAPRHVLLIVIDTLRADHLSCYGYWRETSPHIDALASRGVKFERAISQSSWTSPSMITVMTGQRLSRKRFRLPDDKPTLAELFKDAGYKTGAWVSNPLLNHDNGFHRGFDSWTSNPLREVDGIVEWLRETADRDTFTWVHFTDPHDPYLPPKFLRSGQPGRLSSSQEALIAEAARASEEPADLDQQRAHIADEVGLYDDEVVAVDRKVQQLLDAMDESGTLDDAVIVLTADHGECLWERRESEVLIAHQRRTRQTPTLVQHVLKQTHGEFVYQELVRVPLILVAPGLERDRVDSRVADSIHLAPTILALAGVEVAGMDEILGMDLFGPDVPPGAYSMTNQGEAFLSEDGWKLILPTEEGVRPYGHELQLYDLNQDPGELRNLAADEPERVARLKLEIEQRRATALPLLKDGDWESQTKANAKALQELGYADAGLVDLEDEPTEPAGEDSDENGADESAASPLRLRPSPKVSDR